MKFIPTLLLAASAALGLAACGGGSSEEVPVTPQASNEVPASASASSMAYEQYAFSLQTSETKTPLDVSKVTPPTSETEAPVKF